MGLFKNIKFAAKSAAAPKDMVYTRGEYIPLYTGYENLPDDLKTLRKMDTYYSTHDHKTPLEELNTIRKTIFRKAYELVKQEVPEQQPNWVMDGYLSFFGTEEELNAYRLARLCKTVELLYVPKEYQKKNPDEYLVKKHLLDSLGYNYRKNYGYFEEHLEDIIHAICHTVEKEKHGEPLVYAGYVLYQDLMAYCTNEDENKKFNDEIWKKSVEYLNAAHRYYDWFESYKADKKYKDTADRIENNKAAIVDPMDKEAKINIHLCSEAELLAAWRNKAGVIAEKAEQHKQAEKAHQDALEQRRILVDKGDAEAQVSLAKDAYYGRNGIPQDTGRAFILFSNAEKEGNGEASYYLGEYYENGIGHIIRDEKKAEEYYRKAFRADYVPAIARVANKSRGKEDVHVVISYYKKVLALADEKEHEQYIKQAIRFLIFFLSTGDVDENTVALISLAMDYMRLDAPLVRKSDCDIALLMEEAANGSLSAIDQLEYYYDEYSRTSRLNGIVPASEIFQKDPERAREMKEIVKVLRLMKVAVLLPKVDSEPEKYMHELAQAYLSLGNHAKAEYLTEAGIRHKIPAVLHFAYHNARKLGYDNDEALEFLESAACMGYRPSIDALEHLAELEEDHRKKMEWVEKHKPSAPSRSDLAFELEMVERQIDLMLGGTGSSVDELALAGKISFADASLLRHYKNKLLGN